MISKRPFSRNGSALLLLVIACSCGTVDRAIVVKDAWTRESLPGKRIGAAYMTLLNAGSEAVSVEEVSCVRAERVEFHEVTHERGVMKMRQVPSIQIPARGQIKLRPGGLHLMLFNLDSPLKDGEILPVDLKLTNAEAMTVDVIVRRGVPALSEHSVTN